MAEKWTQIIIMAHKIQMKRLKRNKNNFQINLLKNK